MQRASQLLSLVIFIGLTISSNAAASTPVGAAQIGRILSQAHAAAGGAQLDRYIEQSVAGSVSQGGSPFSVTNVTNLRNGFYRGAATIGPATFMNGYDGTQWSLRNGVHSVVSLPSLVADAITQAYLNSNAYFRPAERSTIVSGTLDTLGGRSAFVLRVEPSGGSPAELTFDAVTHRLVRVVADTSAGRDTTTFSDFQTIQGVPTPMHSVEVDPQGTTTTTTLTSVHYSAALDPAAIARPPYVSHGDLTAPVTVPFTSDLDGAVGHIVVQVALGNTQANLIFDSGGANLLTADAAARLGFKASGDVAGGGAGAGTQMSRFAAVPVVDFGGARLTQQNFLVTPFIYPLVHPKRNLTIDGLIGLEYLANYRIAVRYAQGSIQIAPFDAPPFAGGVTLPFKSDGSHAYVVASVDGASGYFLLDTGNGGGIDLNAPFVAQHHLFPNGGISYLSPGGIGGQLPITTSVAKAVQLAGVTFNDVPVSIVHTKAGIFATKGVAGNFGARLLSRFTVVFNYKAQTVTFIPNSNTRAPFAADRTGLSLDQSGPNAFEVIGVVPKSPAAQVGIAANDHITAVDNTKIATGLGLGDLFPYITGNAPLTLTIARGSATKTVTLMPRPILPSPQ